MKLKPVVPNRYFVPTAISGMIIRDTKHGLVAQKRPAKGARKWSAAERAWQTRFGIAARFAAAPFALDMMTAIEMAKGTEQVPRDILTMAALGRYYEIILDDGTVMGHVPGPIANRQKSGVKEMWQWARQQGYWETAYNTSAFATHGQIFTPFYSYSLQKVRALINTVANAQYRASIVTLDGADKIVTLVKSTDQIVLDARQQLLDFDVAATLDANTRAAVLITRTDATATTQLPISFEANDQWLFPHNNHSSLDLASNNPAVGDTVTPTGDFAHTIAIYLE